MLDLSLADITCQNMVLKMEEQIEMSQQLSTPSKYAGLGAAITAELMISFWFGVGVMLAVGVAEGSNHFIGTLMKGK